MSSVLLTFQVLSGFQHVLEKTLIIVSFSPFTVQPRVCVPTPIYSQAKLLGRLYFPEFGSSFPLEAVNNASLQRNEFICFKDAFESLKKKPNSFHTPSSSAVNGVQINSSIPEELCGMSLVLQNLTARAFLELQHHLGSCVFSFQSGRS